MGQMYDLGEWSFWMFINLLIFRVLSFQDAVLFCSF
jgi:hypothetical protein